LLQRFNRRTVIHSKAGKKLARVLPTVWRKRVKAAQAQDAHGLRAALAEYFFHTDWNHIGGQGSALRGLAILLRLASQIRSAVVSTARMNPQYEGGAIAVANVTARFEKVVNKDIGVLYYHKNPSGNPPSVWFNGILGIEELDQVREDF
jgi:hypothetical protein